MARRVLKFFVSPSLSCPSATPKSKAARKTKMSGPNEAAHFHVCESRNFESIKRPTLGALDNFFHGQNLGRARPGPEGQGGSFGKRPQKVRAGKVRPAKNLYRKRAPAHIKFGKTFTELRGPGFRPYPDTRMSGPQSRKCETPPATAPLPEILKNILGAFFQKNAPLPESARNSGPNPATAFFCEPRSSQVFPQLSRPARPLHALKHNVRKNARKRPKPDRPERPKADRGRPKMFPKHIVYPQPYLIL